jgi:Antirestriction protein (ArdA)
MDKEIRSYVADSAADNAGYLHGVWIDATLDVEWIQEQTNTMLKASPVAGAEELAIHDYEGFYGYASDECAGIEQAHATFIGEIPSLAASCSTTSAISNRLARRRRTITTVVTSPLRTTRRRSPKRPRRFRSTFAIILTMMPWRGTWTSAVMCSGYARASAGCTSLAIGEVAGEGGIIDFLRLPWSGRLSAFQRMSLTLGLMNVSELRELG